MKKKLLLPLFVVMLAPLVMAALPTGTMVYLDFENNAADNSSNNFIFNTASGPSAYNAGKIGSYGGNFSDASSEYNGVINISPKWGLGTGNFIVAFWDKPDRINGYVRMMMIGGGCLDNGGFGIQWKNTDSTLSVGVAPTEYYNSYPLLAGTYQRIVVMRRGSTFSAYHNGTFKFNQTDSDSITAISSLYSSQAGANIGQYCTVAATVPHTMDQFILINATNWSSSEMEEWVASDWNGGAGVDYLAGGGGASNTTNITFLAQVPNNITSTTMFTQFINITYNYFGGWTGPYMNINFTHPDPCFQRENGSCVQYSNTLYNISNMSSFGGSSNVTEYNLYENSVYGGYWPISDDTLENDAHTAQTLSSNDYIFTKFTNFNTSSQQNFVEFMVNVTSGQVATIYACNSTWFNTNPATSNNCVSFGNINSTYPYNHTHSSVSMHNLVSMPFNNGRINGVVVTSTMYFGVRGSGVNGVNLYTVATTGTPDTTRKTTTGGSTWSNQTYTADMHIHSWYSSQYSSQGSAVNYRACGNNGSNYCTSWTTDYIDLIGLNPTTPTITNPVSGVDYTRFVNVTWVNVTTFNNATLARYELDLYGPSYVKTTNPTKEGVITGLLLCYNAETANHFCDVNYGTSPASNYTTNGTTETLYDYTGGSWALNSCQYLTNVTCLSNSSLLYVISPATNTTASYVDTHQFNLTVGEYTFRVQAFDNNGRSSYDDSDPFNITRNGSINVTAFYTSTRIYNFTTTIQGNDYAHNQTNITNDGWSYFDIVRGYNYTVFMNATGYALRNASYRFGTTPYLVNFSLYRSETIEMTFLDEITRQPITQNISVEIFSSLGSTNYTTATSYLLIDLLTPADYTIRYYATGYPTRNYYQTVTAQSYNNPNLYMINNSEAGTILGNVQDTAGVGVENANLKLLRYYVYCNCYEVVEMKKTSYSGEAYLNGQFYEGYYKWMVDYNGVNKFISTSPENLVPSSGSTVVLRTFTIDLAAGIYGSYETVTGLGKALTYNRTSGTMSFSWSDPSGRVTNTILYADYVNGTKYSRQSSSNVNGTSGSIVLTVHNASKSYTVTVVQTINNETRTVYTTVLSPISSKGLGNFGVFIAAGIVITLALLFSYSALAILIVSMLGVLAMSWTGIAPIEGAAISGGVALILGVGVFLMRSR